MCVDYRRLNDLTKKVAYTMPRIDECLDHMRESTVFTKMDLRSGFHQIFVFPEHRERTAFRPGGEPFSTVSFHSVCAMLVRLSSEP